MSNAIYIGIDPGVQGGYCIGHASTMIPFSPVKTGRIVNGAGKRPMPDLTQLVDDLSMLCHARRSPIIVGIEQPGSRPVESAKQGERVGTSYGYIWGVTETLLRIHLQGDFKPRVTIRWVHPSTWCAVVHGTKKKPKELTMAWVEERGWAAFARFYKANDKLNDHVCDAMAIAFAMSEIYPPK